MWLILERNTMIKNDEPELYFVKFGLCQEVIHAVSIGREAVEHIWE